MTKVIAIDGPSASGKGSLAKRVARFFDIPYLNTGALYRLIAWRVLQQDVDVNHIDHHIASLAQNITEDDLELEELFSEKVGGVASLVAKNPLVRKALFDFQRDFAMQGKQQKGGCVLDGRDTGSVICPDADFKFFVTADVAIRARRRFEQLVAKGDDVSYDEILTQLQKRDENDSNRKDAPLVVADGAVVIDNSALSIEDGVKKIINIVNN